MEYYSVGGNGGDNDGASQPPRNKRPRTGLPPTTPSTTVTTSAADVSAAAVQENGCIGGLLLDEDSEDLEGLRGLPPTTPSTTAATSAANESAAAVQENGCIGGLFLDEDSEDTVQGNGFCGRLLLDDYSEDMEGLDQEPNQSEGEEEPTPEGSEEEGSYDGEREEEWEDRVYETDQEDEGSEEVYEINQGQAIDGEDIVSNDVSYGNTAGSLGTKSSMFGTFTDEDVLDCPICCEALTIPVFQELLEPEAAHAVEMLLPDYVNGNLSALCVWPDQVRHWYKYRWTSPLHFIDTPDQACNFKYQRDCHDPTGVKDMCVAGAIQNFTTQLSHYREGNSDRRHNMTEALLFLSHFMGDIHQPMHVGFTTDEGGNTINLRWFRHKSNLHHVWDREIIQTAAADYYGKDMALLRQDIESNFTDGVWSDDLASWQECGDLSTCVNKYAAESINLACKWGYKGVEAGETLSDDYFNSRMPIVMKRIAQGGVRLAMILNHIFGDSREEQGLLAAT